VVVETGGGCAAGRVGLDEFPVGIEIQSEALAGEGGK
jgi:hypothetical protein